MAFFLALSFVANLFCLKTATCFLSEHFFFRFQMLQCENACFGSIDPYVKLRMESMLSTVHQWHGVFMLIAPMIQSIRTTVYKLPLLFYSDGTSFAQLYSNSKTHEFSCAQKKICD